MKILHFAITALFLTAPAAFAQQEGPVPTQSIITVDTKNPPKLTAQNVTVKVNRRATPVSDLAPVTPNGTQVALLIDDGLRTSVGRQLSAPGVEALKLDRGTRRHPLGRDKTIVPAEMMVPAVDRVVALTAHRSHTHCRS